MIALLALAACGADGAPQEQGPATEPGVTVSGTATIGVSGRF